MKNIITSLFLSLLLTSTSLAGDLPNPKLTPGAIDTNVTNEQLCLSGYTGTVRNVSKLAKKKVFAAYALNPTSDKFEIDHLISLELGGKNDVTNLWPQSYTTLPWNAHVKDKLENKLHQMICDGIITKEDAQSQIAKDWIKSYCSIYSDKKSDCDAYLKR
jgi:hypothetical protein